jgi:hypothetical protein
MASLWLFVSAIEDGFSKRPIVASAPSQKANTPTNIPSIRTPGICFLPASLGRENATATRVATTNPTIPPREPESSSATIGIAVNKTTDTVLSHR